MSRCNLVFESPSWMTTSFNIPRKRSPVQELIDQTSHETSTLSWAARPQDSAWYDLRIFIPKSVKIADCSKPSKEYFHANQLYRNSDIGFCSFFALGKSPFESAERPLSSWFTTFTRSQAFFKKWNRLESLLQYRLWWKFMQQRNKRLNGLPCTWKWIVILFSIPFPKANLSWFPEDFDLGLLHRNDFIILRKELLKKKIAIPAHEPNWFNSLIVGEKL